MNHFVSFRARDNFLDALRATAHERGVPVSRLIREVVGREIKSETPRSASDTFPHAPPADG